MLSVNYGNPTYCHCQTTSFIWSKTMKLSKLLLSVAAPLLVFQLSGCGDGNSVTVYNPKTPAYSTIIEEVDNYLAEHQQDNQPGLSILIRKDGEVVYKGSKGLANKHTGERITDSTGFRIASVSKPFTALAVMQLVESGQVQLSDTLDQHIEEIPSAYASITMHQLLSHQSGIPDYINDTDNLALLDDLTNVQLLALAVANDEDELEFTPGTDADYSNTGYVLLAEVVKRVTNMSLPEYLKFEFYDKLGMTNSYMIDENREMGDYGEAVALSHADTADVYAIGRENITFNALIYGSSGQVSSINDMNVFLDALADEQIVSQQTLTQMTQKVSAISEIGDYGLGWLTGTGNYWHNNKYTHTNDYWHSGGYGGYRSILSISPELGLEVVVLSNGGEETQPRTWDILEIARNFYR